MRRDAPSITKNPNGCNLFACVSTPSHGKIALMKIAFLVLALALPAIAQLPTITKVPTLEKPPPQTPPPCPLALAQAPAWGKIKLGMTESDFQKIFPKMPFMVSKMELPEDPVFDNVDNMMFTFYKEHLEEVTIQFDLSMRWDNVNKFTDYLSETYKLPNVWTFSVGTGMLQCKEFAVRAVSSRSEIKLRDTVAGKMMQTENAPPKQPDKPQKPRPFP